MAGTIITDKIQTENSFLTLNVGQTQIASMNSSGIYSSSGAKMIGTDGSIGNSTISGATVSGNLNFDSTGTTGVRSPAANTLAFHTAGTEDIRITSNGWVGVGTTTPANTFTVKGTGIVAERSSDTDRLIATYNDINVYANATGGTNHNVFTLRQSNNTTSNNRLRVTATGLFQFDSGYGDIATAYGCRAWVNFNGTSTVAIRGSGNVSSITDLATGTYTVNLTNALPDANYAIQISSGFASGIREDVFGVLYNDAPYTPTTTAYTIKFYRADTNAAVDSNYAMTSIFR